MAGETFLNGRVTLYCGDSREVLKGIPDGSLDSIVCDPPYALVSIVNRFGKNGAKPAISASQRRFSKSGASTSIGADGQPTPDQYGRLSRGFMGKTWDTGETAFAAEFWALVFDKLKPGGHVVAFSGTRTYHRMVVAVEDAGFEVRDQLLDIVASDTAVAGFMASLNDAQRQAFLRCIEESQFGGQLGWLYGSGFPKSHNVSKAIDKAKGAVRKKVRVAPRPETSGTMAGSSDTRPWIEESRVRGYHEADSDDPASPEAAQWQGYGTALKPAWEPIVLARKPLIGTVAENVLAMGTGALNIDGTRVGDDGGARADGRGKRTESQPGAIGAYQSSPRIDGLGRFPANVIHDGSAEVVAAFPDSVGFAGGGRREGLSTARTVLSASIGNGGDVVTYGDSGSASRFFYTAKADGDDRLGSKHPTVKPVDLMRWLVRLVTPPGGTVLDPFAGTGSTGEAAFLEGMNCILIEREAEYQDDIRRRMSLVLSSEAARKKATTRNKPKPASIGGMFGDD